MRDLAACLRRVRLTVAPLRFGAGIKGKVLESFAHGLPCVMSSIAAEALPLDAVLRACVADAPDDMAALIRLLHDDDARALRISEAGRALVAREYGAAALDRSLSRAIASPLAPHAGGPAAVHGARSNAG